MLHVGTGVPLRQPNGYSLQNYAEAGTAIHTVTKLIKAGVPPGEIGILSLYAGQSRLIEEHLEIRLDQAKMEEHKGATFVATIDSSQGQTKSVIVLVMVASVNPLLYEHFRKQLGNQVYRAFTVFAKYANRLVVALTRAKHGLIIIGNAESLSKIQVPDKNTGLLPTGPTSGYHIERLMAHLHHKKWISDSFLQDENPQIADVKAEIFNLLNQTADHAFNREIMVRRKEQHTKQKVQAQERASFIAGSAFPKARQIPGRQAAKESNDRQNKGGVQQMQGVQSSKAARNKRKAMQKEIAKSNKKAKDTTTPW